MKIKRYIKKKNKNIFYVSSDNALAKKLRYSIIFD